MNLWKIYSIQSGKTVKAGLKSEEDAKDWLHSNREGTEDNYEIEEMDSDELSDWKEDQEDNAMAAAKEEEEDTDSDKPKTQDDDDIEKGRYTYSTDDEDDDDDDEDLMSEIMEDEDEDSIY